MLEKFEAFNAKLSGWIEWIGFGALLLMVFLTCADVIGTKMFLKPVFGSQDVMFSMNAITRDA